MTYRSYDRLTRAYVISDDRTEEYLVDLCENNGVGECSCPWFQIGLQKKVTAGEIQKWERQCKHIVFYRQVVAYELLNKLILTENLQSKPKPRFTFPAGTKIQFSSKPMKQIQIVAIVVALCSGCAYHRTVEDSYNPESKTNDRTSFTGISWFNKTAVSGLTVGKRTEKTSTTLSLSQGTTETQAEAIKEITAAITEGAVRGATKAVIPVP